MANKTRSIGMKELLLGDVAATGMPTTMASLGKTLKGTASFTNEEDKTTEFFSEEDPMTPEESITSEKGKVLLKWNLMEFDNDTLISIFGGSTKSTTVTINGTEKTVEKYVAPKDIVVVEKAARVITPYSVGIDIPRAKITAKFNWDLSRTAIAQVECTATALTPPGDDDGSYEIYKIPS